MGAKEMHALLMLVLVSSLPPFQLLVLQTVKTKAASLSFGMREERKKQANSPESVVLLSFLFLHHILVRRLIIIIILTAC